MGSTILAGNIQGPPKNATDPFAPDAYSNSGLLAGSYRQSLELVANYTQGLKPLDKEKIFGLNAVRFYGL